MFDKRREDILALLQESTVLPIKEISERLLVSEMTIRRDLEKMEREGIVQRSFGGVSLVKGIYIEKPIPVRAANMPQAKRRMAALASNMVEDGDAVFLDTGTTIYELSKRISKKRVHIATSSIQTSISASKGSAKVLLSGGEMDQTYQVLFGRTAENFYRTMYAKYAFVSAGGVSLLQGVTEYTEPGANLKRIMLEQAEKRVLIADHTKFDVIQLFKAVDIDFFHCVITDVTPGEAYLNFFSDHHIELLVADETADSNS